MPTILDELVVLVSLDPSKFSEGQRQVLKDMEDLKSKAAASASSIGTSTKTSLHEHLSSIGGELKDVNAALLNLSSQSRRTGEGVRAAGMSGAEGLTRMATSALQAYVSIKSVNDIVGNLMSSADKTMATARAATFTNLSTPWLSAFQGFANVSGNIPHEVTQSTLNAFEQKRQGYKLEGNYPPEFQQLAFFLGMSADEAATLPLPELLSRVSAAMAGKNGARAQFLAGQVGLGPLTPALALGPEAMAKGVADQMALAPTPEQVAAARALQKATNDLTEHFDSMWRVLSVGLNPALENAILGTQGLIDKLKSLFDNLNKNAAAPPAPTVEGRKWNEWGPIGRAVDWARQKLGLAPLPDPNAPAAPGPGAAAIPRGPAGSDEATIRGAIAAAGGNEIAQAGLLSNFFAESGLRTGAVNPNGGATGYAQWIGSRKTKLLVVAAGLGLPINDPRVQAKMLELELGPGGGYHSALMKMNAASSPEAAAEIGLRGYEGVNESNSDRAGAPWPKMLSTHVAAAARYYSAGSTTNHHVANNNQSVGNLVVNTGSDNPLRVGSAVQRAVQNALVNTANSGLQ